MDKKNIIYIIVVLLIFSVSGYYLYQHGVDYGLAKPALILKVSTNLSEKGGVQVNNITFEQSSVVFFYKRADSIPAFPEIEVNARRNALDSAPASFWASTPFNKDVGVYEVRLLFRDGNEPKSGDILILPLRIIGSTGVIMYKTTSFYQWE
jgi:hypothetical protein